MYTCSLPNLLSRTDIQQQLYEIQQEEDSRPLIRYDLSLIPKFRKSSQSLANIQMVKPVEDSQNFIDKIIPPYSISMNKNVNEKIDQRNLAFPPSKSLLLSLNRQIIVDEDKGVLRNVNDKQVMNK